MSFIHLISHKKGPLMENLRFKYILEQFAKNTKKSNGIISQIRILTILYEARHVDNGWLSRREIIEKYCQEYDKNNPNLLNEYKNGKYRPWFNNLKNLKLICISDDSSNIIKKNHFGKNPECISLDKSVLYPDFGPTKIDTKNKNDAIKVFEFWLAVNRQMNFLALSSDAEYLINQLVEEEEISKIDWIEMSSLRSNLKNKNVVDTKPEFEEISFISDAIKDSSKINFTYKSEIDGTTETEDIKNYIPFFLKEHKRKWYVFGCNPGDTHSFPRNINNLYDLEESDDKISPKEKATCNKLKEEVKESLVNGLGIYQKWHNSDVKNPKDDTTSNHHTEPLKISFKVKDGDKFDNIKYLKMDPIHSTQVESEKDKDGYSTIELKCFPDSDLIREIRKIGLHNIKDIKCEWEGSSTEPLPHLDKWVREM